MSACFNDAAVSETKPLNKRYVDHIRRNITAGATDTVKAMVDRMTDEELMRRHDQHYVFCHQPSGR